MKKIEKGKLTLKQTLFCISYVEEKGNATEAVISAGYNVRKKNGLQDRNLAKSIASENLTKPDIRDYIKKLLENTGFNDLSIKIQHLSLIKQDADLSVKLRAIDMYYKLTGAYSPEKQEAKATVVQVVQYNAWKDKNGNSCFPEKK